MQFLNKVQEFQQCNLYVFTASALNSYCCSTCEATNQEKIATKNIKATLIQIVKIKVAHFILRHGCHLYLHSETWCTHRSCTWRKKHFPPKNLPPKMAAAFHGLITNVGLMAAGMSYSYSSQKQTTSLYLYIWRHWNGGQSRLNSSISQFKTCN